RSIRADSGVITHLRWNGALWLLLLSWGLWLERYNLLLRSDGIVFGAGYTHIHIELPAIWILMILLTAAALLLIAGKRLNLRKILPATALLAVVVLAFGRVLIPAAVQKFNVEPNELELETPYLEHN